MFTPALSPAAATIPILPIIDALAGSKNDTPRITLKINIELQGCCGNVSCCSSQVEQKQINKRRVVYYAPEDEEKGTLSVEQKKNILKIICCCSSESKQKHNQEVRAKVVDFLVSSYGKVPAEKAIEIYCTNRNVEWNDPKEQKRPLSVGSLLDLQNQAQAVQQQVKNSQFYKQVMESTRRIQMIEESPSGSHKSEKADSRWSPYTGPENSTSLVLEPIDEASGKKNKSISIFKLTPHHSPDRSLLKHVTITVPKELEEVLQCAPDKLSPQHCAALYKAVVENEIKFISDESYLEEAAAAT